MIRSFIAIPLPQRVRDALEDIQSDLPVGRPVAAENLHLTLAFLGDQPVPVLEDLHLALDAVSGPAFALEISGLGVFGGRRPRVVFAAVRPDPALTALRARVRGAARAAGIDLPHERFHPHVTLARFGSGLEGADAAALAGFIERHVDFGAGPFPVEHFQLCRSTLTRAGPVYDQIARYDLSAP